MNGLIIQWGRQSVPNGSWQTANFPLTTGFKNRPNISLTFMRESNDAVPQGFLGGGAFITGSGYYKGFYFAYAGSGAYSDGSYCQWLAIGY